MIPAFVVDSYRRVVGPDTNLDVVVLAVGGVTPRVVVAPEGTSGELVVGESDRAFDEVVRTGVRELAVLVMNVLVELNLGLEVDGLVGDIVLVLGRLVVGEEETSSEKEGIFSWKQVKC